jgi:putative FmdB family regulatory protein
MLQTVTHAMGERASDFQKLFFAPILRGPPEAPTAQTLKIDKPAKIKAGSLFPEDRTLPLYEYRCTVCGYSFEKIQNFSAKPETECPKCQGELIRPVTAPALRFEGAGWYVNDYAGKGGAKKAEGGDTPPAAGSDTPKDSKPESKPDSSTGSSETKSAPAAPATPAPSTSSSSSSTPASGS